MGLRITKVYTKKGDAGETRLGGGQKIAKNASRIHAYGTIDELNSVIGVVLAFEPIHKIKEALTRIQHHLFTVGGDLCLLDEDKQKWQTPSITEEDVEFLEKLMDGMSDELKPLEEFILPGGTKVSAFLHQARCVCRRAERHIVALAGEAKIEGNVLKYVNRLSDTLFVMARYENLQRNVEDVYWQK